MSGSKFIRGKEMGKYLYVEWIFIFCIYSVIGFIWETVYCSIRERKLVNRGFMKGPFLPIYGSGVCVMLVAAAPFEGNVLLECLSGMICATVLEYVTGELMQHLFKVRYWDYSQEKFNLNGHICLGASLGWFAATFVVNRILQKPVTALMKMFTITQLTVTDAVVMGIAVIDFIISFKAAMDLRAILVKMEEARHEMQLMQKRLDVIIALMAEDAEDKVDAFTDSVKENIGDFTDTVTAKYSEFTGSMGEHFDRFGSGVSRRLEYIRKTAGEVSDKLTPDSVKDIMAEIKALGEKYTSVIKEHASFTTLKGSVKKFFIGNIIRSNPSIISDDYYEALEELKNASKKK